jgi:hypothetical protein
MKTEVEIREAIELAVMGREMVAKSPPRADKVVCEFVYKSIVAILAWAVDDRDYFQSVDEIQNAIDDLRRLRDARQPPGPEQKTANPN